MKISLFARQRGEGKVGCIVGGLFLLILVYLALKFVPVKVAFADVKDTAIKSAEMGSIKKDEDIRREIQLKIRENQPNLDPIKDQEIELSRSSDAITVKFEMRKKIELVGGKVIDYREQVNERRTLF